MANPEKEPYQPIADESQETDITDSMSDEQGERVSDIHADDMNVEKFEKFKSKQQQEKQKFTDKQQQEKKQLIDDIHEKANKDNKEVDRHRKAIDQSIEADDAEDVRHHYKKIREITGHEDIGQNPDEYNPDKLKQVWINFYNEHNLPELAKSLENVDLHLNAKQEKIIQEKAKEGFNHFLLMPSVELQRKYLEKLVQETSTPIKELSEEQQYHKTQVEPIVTGYNIYKGPTKINENYSDIIVDTDRDKKNIPYLMFVRDQSEAEPLSNQKVDRRVWRDKPEKRGETGFTLSEYLIFQRDFVKRHNAHPSSRPEYLHNSKLDLTFTPSEHQPREICVSWIKDHPHRAYRNENDRRNKFNETDKLFYENPRLWVHYGEGKTNEFCHVRNAVKFDLENNTKEK